MERRDRPGLRSRRDESASAGDHCGIGDVVAGRPVLFALSGMYFVGETPEVPSAQRLTIASTRQRLDMVSSIAGKRLLRDLA